VTDGHVERNARAHLLRDDVVVSDGKIASLRRFKDDVKEVQTGYECGISLENFQDIKPGDVFEVYQVEEVRREL
jgi:translation initiation factor IF-2